MSIFTIAAKTLRILTAIPKTVCIKYVTDECVLWYIICRVLFGTEVALEQYSKAAI